jgi:hypothetical protein
MSGSSKAKAQINPVRNFTTGISYVSIALKKAYTSLISNGINLAMQNKAVYRFRVKI